MLRAISLFTGAGGRDVGFERVGVKILFANEMDSNAAATYRANHPNTKMIVNDINNIWTELGQYRDVDIVFGGSPCQGFSVIGKMNTNDERNQLIWPFLHAVEIVRPRVFIMENVKALAVINKWSAVKVAFIQQANELGYFDRKIRNKRGE